MKTVASRITMVCLSVLVAGGCCTLNQPDDRCGGNTATIMVGPGQLHVKPECLAVNASEPVVFHIKRADGVGEVEIAGKPGPLASGWLDGASGEGTRINVRAPASEANDGACVENVCEYFYEVRVDGIGRLDPRVRVRYAGL